MSTIAAYASIMCKAREKEADAMMSAVAKYVDEIEQFASSAGHEAPAKPDQAWIDFDEINHGKTDQSAVADK